MNYSHAADALNTYFLDDCYDENKYFCGLPKEFIDYTEELWLRTIKHGGLLFPTGDEWIELGLNSILQGFGEDIEDIRQWIEDFDGRLQNSDFSHYDAWGFPVSMTLLKQAVNIKYGYQSPTN